MSKAKKGESAVPSSYKKSGLTIAEFFMNNVKSQDAILFRKSKRRVITRTIFTYLFLVAYCIGVYLAMNHPFLIVNSGSFSVLLMGMIVLQLGIFAVLMMMITTGSKFYRFLYWIAFLGSAACLYVPVRSAMDDTGHLLSFIVLGLAMLVKLYVLYEYGIYLHKNPSAKVLFDHIVEVDEEGEYEDAHFRKDMEEARRKANPKPTILPNSNLAYEQESQEEIMDVFEERWSYQKVAKRLGLCIYGSMMVFPIVIQVFNSLFASFDFEHVFAIRDMFIACMVSALVWTLAVFFLYYNNPKSKMVVYGCIASEVIRIALYLPVFIGYIRSDNISYPLRAYIFFIILDLLRYFLIYFNIKPIFQMEPPLEENTDEQEDEYL